MPGQFFFFSSIPPHRPRVLRTFLGKITRRLSLKKYRDKRREKRGGGQVALALDELGEIVSGSPTPEAMLEARELSRSLNRFVAGLEQTERQIFVRRYWYLDSVSAISRAFGFRESKVKSMLYRTRKKLRSYWQKEGLL